MSWPGDSGAREPAPGTREPAPGTREPAPGAREPAAFCPYLGLVDDPATHFAFPSHAQRCHSERRATTIDLTKQARDCLTPAHVTCSRFHPVAATAKAGASGPMPLPAEGASTPVPPEPRPVSTLEPAEVAPVRRLTPPAGVPAPGDLPAGRPASATRLRGLQSRGRAAQWLVYLLLVLGVGAVGIGIGQLLAQQLRDGAGSVQASQDVGPAVSAAPSVLVVASPDPVSPVPAASEQPTATPAPTATATPTPKPVVHVVRRGETLKAIAERYGVTQRAIVKANSLENPSLIVVGQRLVIPSP